MNKEQAKKWAELLKAYAEGKTIQELQTDCGWVDVIVEEWKCFDVREIDDLRIKPEPTKRRMTEQELSDWLRDCPQEHREMKDKFSDVFHVYNYSDFEANKPCGKDVLIRRNHGDWEEPLIEEKEEVLLK